MTVTKQVRVYVTQEDIDESRKARASSNYSICHECAVARALIRTLKTPISWAFASGHYLNEQGGYTSKENDLFVVKEDYALVTNNVNRFDMERKDDPTNSLHLEPFDFKVEVHTYA